MNKEEKSIISTGHSPGDGIFLRSLLPVVKHSRGRGIQLQRLLKELFVLVNEVSLHLGHLGHDLLPAQSGDLSLPLPLSFVLVSEVLK